MTTDPTQRIPPLIGENLLIFSIDDLDDLIDQIVNNYYLNLNSSDNLQLY